jgi:hypothetical protein
MAWIKMGRGTGMPPIQTDKDDRTAILVFGANLKGKKNIFCVWKESNC